MAAIVPCATEARNFLALTHTWSSPDMLSCGKRLSSDERDTNCRVTNVGFSLFPRSDALADRREVVTRGWHFYWTPEARR